MRHLCNSLLLCGIAFLWVPAADAQDVSIRRVTDRVITLSMSNLSKHTNVTVIETQKGLVCIETEFVPSVMKTIKEAAEKELGRNDWAYVINTHSHLHHAKGNAAFPEIPIIGPSTTMMDWFKSTLSSKEGRRGYCDYSGVSYGIKVLRQTLAQARLTAAQKEELRRRLRFCYAIQKEIMDGFEVRNPTIAWSEGLELDLGDTHLQLFYWGDGINHNSIFVYVLEDKMLVGMGMGREGWIAGAAEDATLEGIRHAISMWEKLSDKNFPIDFMIKVHSPEIHNSRQRSEYSRIYLQTLLDNLSQAMKNGLSLEQAKAKFPYSKEPAAMRRYFYKPENVSEQHLKNIDRIWNLLQKEELTRVDGTSNKQIGPEPRRQIATPMLLLGPVDWRFEAMPLPPRFAPEVKWTGFEEIRFAPGVFDNSSPDYFSYVIALSVNGTSTIDAAGIKDFLETYFRGLLPSMGQRKGLTVNTSQIAAEIAPAETKPKTNARYQGTVAIIDTFTDGRKTTLNVEADVLPQEALKKTHVLLLLSPRARDSKIWKTLCGIRDKTIASSAMATAMDG